MLFMYVPLVTIAITSFLYWLLTKNYNYWKKRNIVSPEPMLIYGNIKELALGKKFIGSMIQDIYNQFSDEKIVGFYRMIRPCLLIRDLDVIKHIMIKDSDVFNDRGIGLSSQGLGANLFTADSESWRVLRTKFTPIFTSGKLKNMFSLISERANRMIEQLENAHHGHIDKDVLIIARMYTMSSIAACAFGLDFDFSDPMFSTLQRIDKLIFEKNYPYEFIQMIPGSLKMMNKLLFPAELTNFFNDLVKFVFTQRNGVPSNRKDFMDLILELKQQKIIRSSRIANDSEVTVELTDEMIAAQAFVFYVAGFETSSATLSFMMYELTQNPHIQNKLIEEIDEVMDRYGSAVTYDALMDMTYLTQVVDETLRKYPIVDPLQRVALDDYKVPGTDVMIKKGELLFVSSLGIHYDEKYYPNPEVFDPERFSVVNSKNRHPCAYLPFGIGPRHCIGMRFAKVQSRMFIVRLLSNFRLEKSKDTPKTMQPNPRRAFNSPHQRVILKLVPRKK